MAALAAIAAAIAALAAAAEPLATAAEPLAVVGVAAHTAIAVFGNSWPGQFPVWGERDADLPSAWQ